MRIYHSLDTTNALGNGATIPIARVVGYGVFMSWNLGIGFETCLMNDTSGSSELLSHPNVMSFFLPNR